MGDAPAPFKLYLGNLGNSVDEDTLRSKFEHIESFADVRVMYDKFDGKPRGFGWAFFHDMKGTKEATALHNRIVINGRAMVIQPPVEDHDAAGNPVERRKRKVPKPIHSAIEIAHAYHAEMDKGTYERALRQHKRPREERVTSLPKDGTEVFPTGPAQATVAPVRVRRAQPHGAQPPGGEVKRPLEGAPARADSPTPAGSTGTLALLQQYGESDSED